jgi:endonuclease YncB( thermonuclease family)
MRSTISGVITVCVLLASAQVSAAAPRPGDPIDGDSVRVGGITVRLLGIDTPEYGRCGFQKAAHATAGLIAGGVRIRQVMGRDRYGRTLAYLRTADGRDVGSVLLRRGFAVARYDSLDGYPAHPKQASYRRLDARHDRPGMCF